MNLKKIIIGSLAIILLGFTACVPNKMNNENPTETSTPASKLVSTIKATEKHYNLSNAITLEYTVTNPTSEDVKFSEYHTPFEGMISNFLEIVNSNGDKINYNGIMAKRITPPPANTYHTLAPGASKSIKFSIEKSYKIEQPGTYIIKYIYTPINEIKSSKAIKINVTN